MGTQKRTLHFGLAGLNQNLPSPNKETNPAARPVLVLFLVSLMPPDSISMVLLVETLSEDIGRESSLSEPLNSLAELASVRALRDSSELI